MPSELSEQIRVVDALRRARIDFFAVPNGGRRNRGEAIRLKKSGVRSGVPDLVILTPPPGSESTSGVVLEMKREDGRPSDVSENQRKWFDVFARYGWRVLVGYGAADALEKLRDLGYALIVCLVLSVPLTSSATPPIPEYTSRTIESVAPLLINHARQYDRRELSESDALSLAAQFNVAGILSDCDPLFLAGVTFAESRWQGRAMGDGGASVGMWQMVAAGVRSVLPSLTRKEARDLLMQPAGRTLAAGLYWSRLIRRYGRRFAAVVYNCGPVRCKRADGSRFTETRATRGYFRYFRRLKAAAVRGQK